GISADAVQYIDNPDRKLVSELLRMDEYVDMIIPRGGQGLHRLCKEQSTIPVITGGIGICHMCIDASADMAEACVIVEIAQILRPSVGIALDTVRVERVIADRFRGPLAERLTNRGVELRADADALRVIRDAGHDVQSAGPDDFDEEWLALILG